MCSVYSDIRDPAPRVDYTVGVISPDLRKKRVIRHLATRKTGDLHGKVG